MLITILQIWEFGSSIIYILYFFFQFFLFRTKIFLEGQFVISLNKLCTKMHLKLDNFSQRSFMLSYQGC